MKILKYIFSIFLYLKNKKNYLFNFFMPNFFKIFYNDIVFGANIKINVCTIFNGEGKIIIGKMCTFGYKLGGFNKYGVVEIQARSKSSKILIGSNVSTNNNVFICAENLIEIGDNTLIGQNVSIFDHDAHNIIPNKRKTIGDIGKVVIEKNVWIGNNVVIMKNSHIGENSIVATGAVVNRNFPPNSIIGGVPAKFIKSI